MPATLDAIETEALKLPPEERVRLADHLLASVSGEQEVEEAWAAEVDRRIAEIEAGRISLVPAHEAVLRARQALA
ncbi:MAG TPA: addiction module protein [Burkholderiaceae bacterium]|nr:addiction module protein [Burkholderiaceae bacterium]